MSERSSRPKSRLGDAIASVVAITVALVFIFPIYWAFSQSLRNPLDTFTVAGLGIPWINFTPTSPTNTSSTTGPLR